jgi:pyruvate/2-oxoglutarate dehydrogenase complex dihydrolipoamide acyltransferase (E2) component
MPEAILMPRLGETVDEATINEWLVEVGSVVELGQPILIIDTDKAQVEVESVAEGIVLDILAKAGETVPSGQVIAHIGSREETA